MGLITGDRILEQTTSTGTGNITLAGAVTGYRAFSAVATVNGDQFPYVIAGSSEWEVGVGTRVSSTTFSRAPTASSNAGALVNFSAGTKEVWIDWTHAFINSMRADNLFINGGMMVSQESVATAQTSISANRYIVDMFVYQISGGAAVVTLQQVTDAPSGFRNSLKISVTTADASIGASERYSVLAAIEGYRAAPLSFGTSGASSVSLGFWVKAFRAGTYTGSLQNASFNRAYTFEYTVNASNTWEYKTITIAGDTTGTWEYTSNTGIYINWGLALGSSTVASAGSWSATSAFGTSNQVNAVQSTSDTFQLTGVSLVPGSVPVSEAQAPLAMRSFDEELALCQRYYCKSFNYATAPAQNTGVSATDGIYLFPATKAGATEQNATSFGFRTSMRASPTVTPYNPAAANGQVRDVTASADCSGTVIAASENNIWVTCTGNGSTAVGNRLAVHWSADARI